MPINWGQLENMASAEAKDLWTVLKPYMPALSRSGQDVVDGFVKHLRDKDWAKIDELMYMRMTPEERRELEDQVVADARAAAQARFDRIQLEKDILFKLALNLILKVL